MRRYSQTIVLIERGVPFEAFSDMRKSKDILETVEEVTDFVSENA